MIKLLKEFINRGGAWFFSSTLFERLTRLALSFFVFSELAKDVNAIWSSALFTVSIFIPIKSLGIESGILQYASAIGKKQQKSIFNYFVTRGFLSSLLFSFFCIVLAWNKDLEFQDSKSIIYILCFWLPSSFLFEFLLSYTRIEKDHKSYAKIQTFYNCVYAILLIVGFWFYGLIGFALAFVFAPLISFFTFFPKFLKSEKIDWSELDFKPKDIVFYGLKTSVTNYASELLFYTDLYLIEYIVNDKIGLSDYRVSTIIPLNLGFFAVIYINNDYVHLVENKNNKIYLKSYLKKYYTLFLPFILVIGSLLFFGSNFIWENFKEGKYADSSVYFQTLLLASMAIILLRIPAGNILSAIGKVHVNTIISYSILLVNIIISYGLLEGLGLVGIAIGTVTSLTLSGGVSLLILYRFLNKK